MATTRRVTADKNKEGDMVVLTDQRPLAWGFDTGGVGLGAGSGAGF